MAQYTEKAELLSDIQTHLERLILVQEDPDSSRRKLKSLPLECILDRLYVGQMRDRCSAKRGCIFHFMDKVRQCPRASCVNPVCEDHLNVPCLACQVSEMIEADKASSNGNGRKADKPPSEDGKAESSAESPEDGEPDEQLLEEREANSSTGSSEDVKADQQWSEGGKAGLELSDNGEVDGQLSEMGGVLLANKADGKLSEAVEEHRKSPEEQSEAVAPESGESRIIEIKDIQEISCDALELKKRGPIIELIQVWDVSGNKLWVYMDQFLTKKNEYADLKTEQDNSDESVDSNAMGFAYYEHGDIKTS